MAISKWRLRNIASVTALLWTVPASAQIEEIVITAQKRAENLQEAPVAVTALRGEALEARGIDSALDLGAFAPNVTIGTTAQGANDMTISMRGLAASDPIISNEYPVAIYVDGVVQPRLQGGLLELVDLESIEVLRGPQGTLYGRNATGGAINFITRRPTDDFQVSQKLGYGTQDHFVSRTSLNTGKIGNTGLKASLAFLYNKQDGYFDNTVQPDDKDPGADNTRAIRGELMFDPGGDFTASYSLYYVAQETGNLASQLQAVGPNLAAALIPGTYTVGGGRRETVSLDAGHSTGDTELYLHNLTLEWQVMDNLRIKAITGYRHYDNFVNGPDLDGNVGLQAVVLDLSTFTANVQPISLFTTSNKRQHEMFSQELQFVGEWTERFKYVFGGFFFTENASERNPQLVFAPGPIPPSLPAGLGVLSFVPFAFNTEADSYAIFGQGTYIPPILDDKMSWTLGLRYTEDTKSAELLNSPTVFVPVRQSQKSSFNNLSYAATIDYKWTSDIMSYVKYSTGYKSGGINTRSTLQPFSEEVIEAYEGGLKASWFRRHLQTNLAVFYNKYRNLQVPQFVASAQGAVNIVTNAGKAHYQGVELEIVAEPFEGLLLNFNIGYVDPQYDQYRTADPGAPGNPIVDVARNADFAYVSEVTANAGIQYDSRPISWIGGGKFQGRIDVLYQSEQTWHPAIVYPSGFRDNPAIDFVKGDARTLVNGRVALQEIPLGGTGATVEVALWGKNILDEAYVPMGIDFGSLDWGQIVYGWPRSGGFEMIFRY